MCDVDIEKNFRMQQVPNLINLHFVLNICGFSEYHRNSCSQLIHVSNIPKSVMDKMRGG